MRESRKQLKWKARKALLGWYPTAVGIYILTVVMAMALLFMMEVGAVLFLGILRPALNEKVEFLVILGILGLGIMIFLWFMCLMVPGYLRFYLNLCQGGQARFTDMFWGFGSCKGRFWGIGFVIILLGGVLLLPEVVMVAALEATEEVLFPFLFLAGYNIGLTIVGFYVGLTYGQFYLILADHPEMSLYRALEESKALMRGNRWRFFVLCLSFLGWFGIAYITFGLALLWLVPYILATNVYFYLNLKEMREGRTWY